MVYTGEDYDDIRESDPHFKTMESDFAAIVGDDMGITCKECNMIMINNAEAKTRATGKCSNCGKPWLEEFDPLTTLKDQPTIRTFKTGATRDTDKDKLDWEGFISPFAMRYFAEYMHEHRHQTDGTLRDADNWQKGMPRRQYMKSLVRHVWDLWTVWRETGGDPQDSTFIAEKSHFIALLCAIMFNVQGILHEIAIGRDVDDG